MRASRILSARPERAIVALADLCEERKDEELVVAPPYQSRPASLPPQTPYTVGNQTLRPKVAERFSPPAQFFEPGPRQVVPPVTLRPPPEHMAPKRGKWTSPPPPEAPPDDHNQFESQLGIGLQLATSSTDAREQEAAYNSSESNSEVFTDEGSDVAEDDMRSVRSYTEGSSSTVGVLRRPSWHTQDTIRSPAFVGPSSASSSRSPSTTRGRFSQANDRVDPPPPSAFRPPPEFVPSSSHSIFNKRSLSGSPRAPKDPTLLSITPLAITTPLPPSPVSPLDPKFSESSNVYYQTTATRSPRPTVLYPNQGSPSSFLSRYQTQSGLGYSGQVPNDIFPPNLPPSLSSSLNPRLADRSYSGPETPTPATYHNNLPMHRTESPLNTTRTETSSPKVSVAKPSSLSSSRERSPLIPQEPCPAQPLDVDSLPKPTSSSSATSSPNSPIIPNPSAEGAVETNGSNTGTPPHLPPMRDDRFSSLSPQPRGAQVDSNSNGSSPAHSSTGYATSISRSPSPHSPSPPLTARLPVQNGQKGENGKFEAEMGALSIDNIVVDLDEGDGKES
jgi:terminal uridylyltransferase